MTATAAAVASNNSKVILDFKDILANYDPNRNTTHNRLTRYEKTEILGMRMEQLCRGAPPLVSPLPTQEEADALGGPAPLVRLIAMRELEARKIPFMVQRTLANGEKEYWRLEDMIVH